MRMTTLFLAVAACTPADTAPSDAPSRALQPPIAPWTQSLDVAPDEVDFADYAWETLLDAGQTIRYVIGNGLIERDTDTGDTDPPTDDFNTNTGYVRAYDTAGNQLDETLRIGTDAAGAETRLFNAVWGTEGDDTYLYVTGKTTTDVLDICDDGANTPATTSDGSMNGLILQIDPGTLEIVDCLEIQNNAGYFDEISALAWDPNGALWIAGSTKGNLAPNSRVHGSSQGLSESSSDFYAARITPDLDTAPLFYQLGSVDFDEALGSSWDAAHQTFYVAGSTKGDLCATYPSKSPVSGCTNGQGGVPGSNFDAWIGAIRYDGVSQIGLHWLYQFGVVGDDVGHDVQSYSSANHRYLYESGYWPGVVNALAADTRVGRIELDANGKPLVSGGSVVHVKTRIDDADNLGDSSGNLYLGTNDLWVGATMHGGADHAHGGACGSGASTASEGHLYAFPHATFATNAVPVEDDAYGSTDPNAPWSVIFAGLTYEEGEFWMAGATTAPGGEAGCGDIGNRDVDDETDAAVYHIPIASP
jgi:hypothetical protein